MSYQITQITITFDPPLATDSVDDIETKSYETFLKLNDWSGQVNTVTSELSAIAQEILDNVAEAQQMIADTNIESVVESAELSVAAKNDVMAYYAVIVDALNASGAIDLTASNKFITRSKMDQFGLNPWR